MTLQKQKRISPEEFQEVFAEVQQEIADQKRERASQIMQRIAVAIANGKSSNDPYNAGWITVFLPRLLSAFRAEECDFSVLREVAKPYGFSQVSVHTGIRGDTYHLRTASVDTESNIL